MPILAFHHITFAHEGALAPLIEDVTVHFSSGWTGIVGVNGSGKTTVLQLALGTLEPRQGTVDRPEHIVFCPQRTDHQPSRFNEMLGSTDPDACILRGKLRLGDDWAKRWDTLSHGERKRSQIAVALWQRPDVLLIDEPTNHIDVDARALLADALSSFRGIGLLVSHDRELLDLLCRQCLFLDPPDASVRRGNYTNASAEAKREEDSAVAERVRRKQELARLTRTSQVRHAEAAKADKKRSKRGLAKGDSDARAKIDLARVSGKDGQAGRLADQLQGRLAQAQERVDSMTVKKRYTANFWMESSVSPREHLFSIPEVTIELDSRRKLHVPTLAMRRQDRIAVTGANGLGKSTLIRHILAQLDLQSEQLVYLPQEIDLDRTREIMTQVHDLSKEQLGRVMSVVSGLGSRPERLLENLDASPGELRKVLLALGVIRSPYLIVMDEPTNHLDLPAIELLENALSDCPCGLLLVSHDLRFLQKTCNHRWHLTQDGDTVRLTTNASFESGTVHENQ